MKMNHEGLKRLEAISFDTMSKNCGEGEEQSRSRWAWRENRGE